MRSQTNEAVGLKRALLAVVSVLAANPAVLYVLTGRFFLSLAVTAAAVALPQALYKPGGRRLPLVYAVNFLLLASTFAHAEFVFDARFSEYAPENLYSVENGYYFNLPGLKERFVDKEYTAHYFTNAQGLRIAEGQNADERVEAADWLFIGDSFTQGAQVEFDDLYTTRLYRAFPDRVVVNAGISGFGIPQAYRYYLDQGHRLGASVVFLQLSPFNDLMNVRETEAGLSDHLVQWSDFVRFLLQDIKYQNPPELPLGRWAEPFHPDEESNEQFNVFYTRDAESKRGDLAEFVRYLGLFKDAVERDGAELVVLFLPTKEQAVPRFLEEVVQEFEIDPAMLDMGRPNRIVASACDSLGIGLIDLIVPFRSSLEPPFYEYDEHLSASGHAVMARAVAEALSGGGVISGAVRPGRVEVLSRDLASDRYPVEYEAGGVVSFQSIFDGSYEVVLADSSFFDIQRVTVDDVDQGHPMFSPGLDRVVLTEGDPESQETEVVEWSPGTGRRRALTAGPEFGAIPVYDASASRVAYAEWRRDGRGGHTPSQIVVLDLATGRKTAVSPEGEEAWRPAFAPDGRVAYIKRVRGQFDIFVRAPAGGPETRLTATPYDEWDPSFSPDGQTLAYAAKRDGNWDLFALVGSRTIRLTRTLGDEWDPSFAPDGRSLLFAGHFGMMKGVYRLRSVPGR
ncbi:MAG: hypothetical protein CMM84_19580 [Rhodothermaceae bacterium]|nr:hypothetical protein [Rhodothermaceae bacterium]MBC12426.1 hypothetical protein [Rhodothermaceae bacterium]